jgi:hypothetical protein
MVMHLHKSLFFGADLGQFSLNNNSMHIFNQRGAWNSFIIGVFIRVREKKKNVLIGDHDVNIQLFSFLLA